MKKKFKNDMNGLIGASVGIGVGSVMLGEMPGGGAIAGKTMTPMANMMGAVIPATMGMNIMNQSNRTFSVKRGRKKRKR